MDVLAALDDGIAALTWLRGQVADGQVDQSALQELMGSGFWEHELVRGALAALAGEGQPGGGAVVTGEADPSPPAGAEVSEPVSAEGSQDPAVEPAAPAAEPAASAGEDQPAEEEAPPSPHAEAEGLMAGVAALPGSLEAMGVHVPGQAADFCKKAGRATLNLPDDEKKGELLASLLFKAMGVLDGVQGEFLWSGQRAKVLSALDGLRGPMAAFLESHHNLSFVPPVGLTQVDKDDALASAVIEWVPAQHPQGTVLAIVSRAFRRDGAEGGRVQLIAASGAPVGLRARLLEIWQGVESDGAGDPAADLAKLSRYIHDLKDDDEVAVTSTARHALNLIYERNTSGAHDGDIKWLLALLAKQGITTVTGKVGRRFDESYSPSKYERQLVYADAPAGTIVRIVRLGLLDSGGIPLQKAVLGVSRGTD